MHHYSAAKLALENGKHCIVEKPFTCCPTTARKLFELAKEKNLFLMEALWSNFVSLNLNSYKVLFDYYK